MDDRLLVEALRSRDPGALAAVYDAYAARLYAYCWSHLLSRDAAQVALRDTFIVAEAHIDRLREADRFAPWLYAIARLECARRLPLPGQQPDLPIASHDQDDVDQRVIAWRAVRALTPQDREALDLRVRHQLSVPDLAAVLDLPAREAQTVLTEAREDIGAALTAEVLGHLGSYGCSARAEILSERTGGDLDPAIRGRLLAHGDECDVCGAHRPSDAVSPAKVFGLLPYATPPASLRVRVMSCFTDPELVSYRLFVATRTTEFTPGGVPRQARRGLPMPRKPRKKAAKAVAATLAAAVGIAAAAMVVGWLAADRPRDARTTASQNTPRLGGPSPSLSSTNPPPSSGPVDNSPIPISATFPLGAIEPSAPDIGLPSPPSPGGPAPHVPQTDPGGGVTEPPGGEGTLVVSPRFLDVGTGTDGTVIVEAVGGDLVWRAHVRGPIKLSVHSGKLRKGQTATLHVRVFRAASSHGEGSISFGTTTVTVTWRPQPPPPPTSQPPSNTAPPSTPPSHATQPPHTDPPATTQPPHTEPPTSGPPTSNPPSSDPPTTDPPSTQPPASEPPKPEPTTAQPTTAAPSPEPQDPPSTEPTTTPTNA